MSRLRRALPLILLLLIASPGFADWGQGDSANSKAPDFILKDIYGRSVDSKAYRGHNTLFIFTTTWCPYCKKEIPELKKLHAQYRGRLEVVAIYINESPYKVYAFARKNNLPYTVLLDPEGDTARSYFVMGVPNRVLVDKQGRILCWMCQSLDPWLERLFPATKK